MISRAELVVLLTMVVNMVIKPVGQPGWFWGILAVMVLGVVAVVASYLRSEQRLPAAATQ
jgi:Na+/melibiose symporter-like transporter